MLKLHVKKRLLPIFIPNKTVKKKNIKWDGVFHAYRVMPNGLRRYCGELVTANVPLFHTLTSNQTCLELASTKQPPCTHLHPALRRLFNELRQVNVTPKHYDYSRYEALEVWFDISSETRPAYYKLEAMVHYGKVDVTVYCTRATPAVVENASKLDDALHLLFAKCRIPPQDST